MNECFGSCGRTRGRQLRNGSACRHGLGEGPSQPGVICLCESSPRIKPSYYAIRVGVNRAAEFRNEHTVPGAVFSRTRRGGKLPLAGVGQKRRLGTGAGPRKRLRRGPFASLRPANELPKQILSTQVPAAT